MKNLFFFFTLFLSITSYALTPKEAFEIYKKGNAVLIDVREDSEVKEGMIDGAVWYPLSKIERDKNWLNEFSKLSKDKRIFLYCRSGRRSGTVQGLLKKHNINSENLGGFDSLKTVFPSKKPTL